MELTVKDYQTMRDALARLCEYFSENQVPRESLFTSRLVASELVGNVLRHSMGEARIRGEVKEGYVELVVFSSVHFVPPKKSVCAEVLCGDQEKFLQEKRGISDHADRSRARRRAAYRRQAEALAARRGLLLPRAVRDLLWQRALAF